MLRVLQELKVQPEHKALQDHLDQQAQLVLKVLLAHKVHKVQQVPKVLLAHKVLQELKVQ